MSDIGSQASFWLLFVWSFFFHPLTLKAVCVFGSQMSLLKAAYSCIMFLKKYSANICLLIDELNSFNFKVITDNEGFISAIVLFVFCIIFCCSSASLILTYFVFDWFFFLYIISLSISFYKYFWILVVTMGITVNILNL